jgi:hypothetical protein
MQLRPLGRPEVLLELPANPLEPVELDHSIRVPEGSAALELTLLTDAGESVHVATANLA